ncbi:MAG TPA: TonB-dependent receptor, partial [Ohtaekwangia sp.]|nr:TonB-dependent receptor [Ohtaekwangia sp.]
MGLTDLMTFTKHNVWIILLMVAVCSVPGWSQQVTDSLKTKQLDEVTVKSERLHSLERLPRIQGTRIWSGKKNEVINVQSMDVNIAEKTARQIFAKVPGVFVYDMDGAGNQVNISTRGLDPHRGWEFNIRRNDAITNSDMYGYPASHYSMPMEAVERIQLVRGTGSLQYGAQFGGLLNYITKRGDTTRAISFESINTMGSYGLLSTYNAIGGRIGKVDYYVYANKRVSEGYRDNGSSSADAESALIIFRPTNAIKINFELSHSKYLHQLAGALNDGQFKVDPRQATRARNYYSPDIYIPSVNLDWQISHKTKLTWITSAVLGTRKSVMFNAPAHVEDIIDPQTLTYAPRQIDIDKYNSYTSELRLLHQYNFIGHASSLVAGVQLMNNDLHRRQQGAGTTGSDYDLTLTQPGWGRNLHFATNNIAVFLENYFQITERFSITPGIRAESGKSDLSGTIKYYPEEEVPTDINHKFVLAGVNMQYTLSEFQNIYTGWSQAYRPVILMDIIPSSTFEKVDDNLKDADGYNFEMGYRGMSESFRWDVSYFQLRYNNRFGMLSETDQNGDIYYLRTNIGNVLTNGVELFAEYFLPIRSWNISFFTSTSWTNARYREAYVRVNDVNVS